MNLVLAEEYSKEHCWQYEIRLKNTQSDLMESGLSEDETKQLRVSDFKFEYVDKTEIEKCDEIIDFIKKHEWLGKMPNRPTHRFTARYKGILAGVVIFTVPNTMSKLVGDDTFKMEKLISRGACISWSPKNLNSWLIMQSINWTIKNTDYRVFTAYSDPEAKELGSIYQACSFFYLGNSFGASVQYLDPTNEKIGWFTDRHFRHRTMYKKYVLNLGLDYTFWRKNYMKKYSPDWTKIPEDLKIKIKAELKKYKETCKVRNPKPKHKYVYVRGRNKNETKKLLRLFNQHNKILPYPKNRGK